MKALLFRAAVIALLAVSTVYCTCTRANPSACSTQTPATFMELYDSHKGTGPVNISVQIGDLNQAKNSPVTFTDIPLEFNRTFPTNGCNPGVCNNTCGFRAPNIFDFFPIYGRANCPWNYICDYDPQRIPQYLYLAQCMDPATFGNSRLSEEVYYPIPVLRTVEPSCDPLNSTITAWKWDVQLIPVACICLRS